MKSFLAIIITIIFIAASSFGQSSYYVSGSGDDSNSGTITSPWKSIQKAANTVSAGSTVFVRAGIYNEAVKINVSGNESTGYITFQNYPGELPVIDGSGIAVPSNLTGLVYIQDENYIVIKGFEIRNYKTSVLNNVPVGIRINGTAHHIQILNNIVHNIEQNGTASSGVDAHGICVYGTSGTNSINNIIIDGNELYSLILGSSESLVVNGNVQLFRITNNKIHDNNNIGIDAIGFEGNAPANDQARNGVISGNRVYNIESYGNPAYGTDRSADGIYVDGGRDLVIERNIVSSCDIGIELASEHAGHSTSNITMRSNFIYMCGLTGIAIGGYDKKRGSTDSCKILNNTLYANDTLHWESGDIMLQFDIRDNVFKNNIVYANDQNVLMSNLFTADTENIFDYNLYYFLPGSTNSAGFQFQWMKVKYNNFAAYQAASGSDSHSFFVDPLFVNASLQFPDLHLKSGSPAIDAGIASDSIGLFDIDGDPRILGTIDIGAVEYSASSVVTNSGTILPSNYELFPNYPNPFNPSTTIDYSIPKSGNVKLTVYNLIGSRVASIVNEFKTAGNYSVHFNAANLASGIYFYLLESGDYKRIKKLVLIK